MTRYEILRGIKPLHPNKYKKKYFIGIDLGSNYSKTVCTKCHYLNNVINVDSIDSIDPGHRSLNEYLRINNDSEFLTDEKLPSDLLSSAFNNLFSLKFFFSDKVILNYPYFVRNFYSYLTRGYSKDIFTSLALASYLIKKPKILKGFDFEFSKNRGPYF